MANGWVIQESGAVVNNEPVMVRIDYDIPDDSGKIVNFFNLIFQFNWVALIFFKQFKSTIFFQITNFDRTRTELFDFDVGRCDIKNKHLRFTISSKYTFWFKFS